MSRSVSKRNSRAQGTDPQISVVVRPDRDLAIQKFIDVMDILKRVGIGRVGVMTRREGGSNGAPSELSDFSSFRGPRSLDSWVTRISGGIFFTLPLFISC